VLGNSTSDVISRYQVINTFAFFQPLFHFDQFPHAIDNKLNELALHAEETKFNAQLNNISNAMKEVTSKAIPHTNNYYSDAKTARKKINDD
jgi:hypothetical protein